MTCSADKISSGYEFSLVILSNGSLFAFGNNDEGQLGNGNNVASNVPIQISMGGKLISSIAGGGYHSLVILSNGSLFTFGYNNYGQLGNGKTVDSKVPILISIGGISISSIAGGSYHSLVILSNGSLFTFGRNEYGELGNGNTDDSSVPIFLKMGGMPTSSIAGGFLFSVIILSNGSLFTFGDNEYGALGNGNNVAKSTPIRVSIGGILTQSIATGHDHSLVILSNGSLFTFGRNIYGALGNRNNNDAKSPTFISIGGISISAIAGGGWHSLVILANGTLFTFGFNVYGQLGNGNTVDSSVPIPISIRDGSTTVSSIAGGTYFSLVILSNGGLFTFGTNGKGQLGNGNNNNSNVPIQILCTCQSPNITNAPTPSCVEGTIIPSESYCTIICNNGYTPNISTIQCISGSFISSFKCNPTPCFAPNISNGMIPSCKEGFIILSQSSCTPQCSDGYSPNVTNITCQLGSFSTPLWKCSPNNCTSPNITNSPIPSCIEGLFISSGSLCRTQCNIGYSPSVNNVSCHLGSISSWYCIPIVGCPTLTDFRRY